MTNAGRPRCQNADESGSALVLALLVVLVVGSGLAVALDYVGTGFTLAPNVRDNRNASNYVQGAVEGAINQIRSGTEAGRPDTSCPTFTPSVPGGLDGVSGRVFSVTCTGLDPGSGVAADQPRFAIHALGSGAEGIRQVAGNDQLYIDGGTYSKGVTAVEGGGSRNTLRVNGSITSEGPCSGPVTSTYPLGLTCSAPAGAAGSDPGYGPAIADAAALAEVASVSSDGPLTCAGGRVEFPAGYYSERPDVLVAKLLPACTAKVWHFQPGRHYFDYNGVWDLDDIKVVGGTIAGGWSNADDLGGACDSSQPGVQLLFGGDSRLFTRSSAGSSTGGLELCGPPAGHAWPGAPQRIVLYGLSPTNAVSTPADTAAILAATTVPVSSPGAPKGFTVPTLAQTINGLSDVAGLAKNETVTLSYGTLSAAPPIPPGARVSAVRVKVGSVMTNASARVLLEAPGGSTVEVPVDADCSTPCVVDVTAQLADRDALWRTLSRMTVTLTVKGSSGSSSIVRTAAVDGVQVLVTYRPPALRSLTCTTACIFFQSVNNPNIFLHGTVYTPSAAWAVNVHNNGETIFERGIVMRDIAITMSSSSKQETSPFQIPRGTPNGRLVLFRGYVDGVETVRACARYVDHVSLDGGKTAAYAGWSLTVPRWLVMRTPSGQPATCS